ncbi:MAG: hypothetical protein IJJ01_07515 [Firmicutes bacterium]|nr:hypothetical protein [Bacillota bacterium]
MTESTDTTIEFEIQYLKGEIKSMHSVGMLVPSRMYERLHRLEKKRAREKRDVERMQNERL